mmetsp:Transcript_35426/g.92219  ORF Transcript_35426/g.92219 Transcript_35426/m.92219 type:complete len:205 (+) Transcript_35426:2062-2676(+)
MPHSCKTSSNSLRFTEPLPSLSQKRNDWRSSYGPMLTFDLSFSRISLMTESTRSCSFGVKSSLVLEDSSSCLSSGTLKSCGTSSRVSISVLGRTSPSALCGFGCSKIGSPLPSKWVTGRPDNEPRDEGGINPVGGRREVEGRPDVGGLGRYDEVEGLKGVDSVGTSGELGEHGSDEGVASPIDLRNFLESTPKLPSTALNSLHA